MIHSTAERDEAHTTNDLFDETHEDRQKHTRFVQKDFSLTNFYDLYIIFNSVKAHKAQMLRPAVSEA